MKLMLFFVVKKQIDKFAVINYSLVSSPNFTESYADVFIKVSIIRPGHANFGGHIRLDLLNLI